MTRPKPPYACENCSSAYQLNWSLSLFAREPLPPDSQWERSLTQATEPDGVRVLEHRLTEPQLVQFFLSTKPAVAPSSIVRSVKGRLQYLLRDRLPRAFRRNYRIETVGAVNAKALDKYIAGQTKHHPMADPRVQRHIALGCDMDAAPASVALDFMNNIAYTQQMRPVLRVSFYVGGFGPHDRNVVHRAFGEVAGQSQNRLGQAQRGREGRARGGWR